MNKPQLWTKDFLIDSMANFLICLVYYLLMVIIAVYAMDNLQASPSEAGLATGIFIVAALFHVSFPEDQSNKWGGKRCFILD
jgi:hypothetical protein